MGGPCGRSPGKTVKEEQLLDIQSAYRYCEELTRQRESNFSLGFSLLPSAKKTAIHVVYAFCRYADDLSDEVQEASPEKLLSAWRSELDRVYSGEEVTHPISVALRAVLAVYPVPKEGFLELIAGCVADQSIKAYADFEALAGYCDLVATSIAKVSLPVYGFRPAPEALGLGRDLSFAFQLTNILRDVAEDHGRGRVYLPQKDLAAAGLTAGRVVACAPEDAAAVRSLYASWGARCESYFKSGWAVLEYLDAPSRPCVAVMWRVYHEILLKILKDPEKSLRQTAALSADEKRRILEEAGRSLIVS